MKTKVKGGGLETRAKAYWGKHPHYTAFVHSFAGLGAGLILRPWVGDFAVTIGIVLIIISVLGHIYALVGE